MNQHREDIFVDIQGYNCSYGYIPKEIAFYDGICCSNYLFKAPFNKNMLSPEDKKIVQWSEEYHGLEWEMGNIEFNEIDVILKHVLGFYSSPKIHVKGIEKGNILRKFLQEDYINNIPINREPKLSKFKKIPGCYFHKNINPWHCALTNVKLMYNYKFFYE